MTLQMQISAISTERHAPPLKIAETERYRLILFNDSGTAVLLENRDTDYVVPEIQIPRFTRPAEQITCVLRENWGIAAILLWSAYLDSALDGAAKQAPLYAIMEVLGTNPELPANLGWFSIQKATSYLDEQEESLLRSSQAKATQPHFGVDPAPFSRLGWFGKLQGWVQSKVPAIRTEATEILQLNGSETFSLLRLGTAAQRLWFKAVGKPNLHEFTITLVLAKLFPDYLPTILASDRDLNAWLMESAGQMTLDDFRDPSVWRIVVERLATLARGSVGKTAELLRSGCRDLRTDTLSSLVGPFFEIMISLMEQQTKNSPPPLKRCELGGLASAIGEALCQLDQVGVPDSLGHQDMNLGNFLLDGHRCRFIDWAEAYVGPPLLTLEYLLLHLCRAFSLTAAEEDDLRAVYRQCLLPADSIRNISRAFEGSPLIAAFAYAASSAAWRDPERIRLPHVAAYFRSLTRTMNKEARLWRARRKESLK